MKKAIGFMFCLFFMTSLLYVPAYAEDQSATEVDERFLSGWNAEVEVTDKTIIDAELSEYNISEMPAIRVSEYINYFNPDTDGSLDIYTEGENTKGAFLLYCEETGTVLWVRHIITDEQTDTVEFVRSFTSDSYPFWLEIAVNGSEAKSVIPQDAVIQNIVVCNGAYVLMQREEIIYFYTDKGTYVSVCNEGQLRWHDKKDSMFTFPLEEFLPLFDDYCKYHSAYYESLPDGYIGGGMATSFFVKWMKGTAPKIENNISPLVYVGIVVAFAIVIAVVVVITVRKKKRRVPKALNPEEE